ncbi:hypothetical protein EM20IM_07990 [Candidatus Methylacidiphilum infernorum]|uniref:Uncharacterized protein n=1 Tax=Candidatus Methylacidiphilum infernorum TaxID=511746 RepID=A0ABX7PUM1_9BACT|nr:hypothetical protein [Candidatus Methylacidiphilum infernorum]QSR86428.1 hypothetical protein EM20IM_07990 [Candidatus Methylacidiphilum infernorum]
MNYLKWDGRRDLRNLYDLFDKVIHARDDQRLWTALNELARSIDQLSQRLTQLEIRMAEMEKKR